MEIIGYISAVLVGLSLGLIGGGGSILTIPILVYLFGITNTDVATSYSLFVVGISSTIGSYKYVQKDLVNLKTALTFGLPAVVVIFLTRKFIIPNIPNEIMTINGFELTKDMLILSIFSILMIAASLSMIKGRKGIEEEEEDHPLPSVARIGLNGALVGLFTGLVGAGGGFLIIPALIALFKLSMKEAVGTSLVIIAINSLFGFLIEATSREIDWVFLGTFTSIAVVGIYIGSALSNQISGSKLKPAFGWFVLIMGIFILGKSLIF